MARNELITLLGELDEKQIAQLQNQAEEFLHINTELNDTTPHACPCCKSMTSRFVKKGFSRRKQRYQCKECGKRFTYDVGKITSGSHQTETAWATFIADTISLKSIDDSALHIGVCHTTAFYMRQKLLAFLEDILKEGVVLDGMIEADETYVQESQKGKRVADRKPRKHGESASKRGLSGEKMCICVAADREGNLTACCVNRAKPSSEDIENAIGSSILEGSVFQCDGAAAYNHLIAEKKCIQIILNSHADYNKVYHLNTVNGLHSRLKEIFKRFRGVSSKYLNRYLAMFVAMEQLSERSSAVERIRLALTRTDATHTIKQLLNQGLLAI